MIARTFLNYIKLKWVTASLPTPYFLSKIYLIKIITKRLKCFISSDLNYEKLPLRYSRTNTDRKLILNFIDLGKIGYDVE